MVLYCYCIHEEYLLELHNPRQIFTDLVTTLFLFNSRCTWFRCGGW
jgi:hypothetical protein